PVPLPRRPILIEPITPANLPRAREMEPDYQIARFRQFLLDSDAGYFALLDGHVVHRSWVQFGPRIVQQHYDLAPYRLHEHEAYIHFCETAPAARGLGIYPAVLAHILRELKMKPVHRCYIATTADNTASQRGIEKVGFKPFLRTEIKVIFGHIHRHAEPLCVAS
ncbi:MAG: GNAT family N-acetyltransferase, partial [Verrucomicrobiae bacterium]|nr:GNAT family N-acetyltransferase [Verrucomicrobiae bacterium]